LVGLSAQYTKRRDFFVDLLFQKFDIKIEELSDKSNGSAVYRASLFKSKLKGPIFSFVPPVAGMFVWASANSDFQSPCAKVIAVEIFF
jgi:aromatic amino acid aminotransferase I